ncbi:MAG: hypothetical protein VX153_09195 [Verrucomicrobiota bacterium]|nr:hypothetical protein [Verrucomicrobiota bacterium]
MKLKTLFIFLCASFAYNASLFSQDSGESAAEASVTGSASQPVLNPPDTSDSNPVVSLVRVGVPIKSALTISIDKIQRMATALNSGGSFNIESFVKAASSVAAGSDIDSLSTALESGLSVDSAVSAVEEGYTVEQLEALSSYSSIYDLTTNVSLTDAINAVIASKSESYSADNIQVALTEAVKVAETLLVDQVITSELPSTISVASLSSTGYNYELVRLLVEYGAIGDSGSSLAESILGSEYAAFTGTGTLSAASTTTDYLSYLSTLTGSATFGDIDATNSVLTVPMSNISLAPGSDITLGSSGSDSQIDVSNILTTSGGVDAQRKILVVGAAKDLTVLGNVEFTNTNKAEDNALVVGAADNVMIDGASLSYDGANLAIGAGDQTSDSLWLANTSITAGGNLAVGSLGTLNISNSSITVGQSNSPHYDPDNVYLYANDLIQANGLSFSGSGLDDVYMEAITLNLSNVSFPSNSDVMLRSRDGSLYFDQSTPVVGAVNMSNVSHGDTVLERSHFDGIPGHHDSSILLPNGTPAIKIRKQY